MVLSLGHPSAPFFQLKKKERWPVFNWTNLTGPKSQTTHQPRCFFFSFPIISSISSVYFHGEVLTYKILETHQRSMLMLMKINRSWKPPKPSSKQHQIALKHAFPGRGKKKKKNQNESKRGIAKEEEDMRCRGWKIEKPFVPFAKRLVLWLLTVVQ